MQRGASRCVTVDKHADLFALPTLNERPFFGGIMNQELIVNESTGQVQRSGEAVVAVDFRIGDIIEFEDHLFKGEEWSGDGELFIGRIVSIHKHFGKSSQIGNEELEIWLEYYSEIPGRMFTIPKFVKRIVVQGDPLFLFTENHIAPLSIGTKVIYHEKKSGEKERRPHLDEISGQELILDETGRHWNYYLKYSEYSMKPTDLEVTK